MPRYKRNWENYACHHLTHRCHERKFLFKFSKHRDLYLKYLFETKKRFRDFKVLDFIVTSNHVHLLVTCDKNAGCISSAMQFLHGEVAQDYNILKNREGSFWTNRFHATLVQNGEHLHRCFSYIDFNMVRCGAVSHPLEWRHSGFHQLVKTPQRYRIIDIEAVMDRLGKPSYASFKDWYIEALEENLCERRFLKCETFWTKAIAVGSKDFLMNLKLDMKTNEIITNELGYTYLQNKHMGSPE